MANRVKKKKWPTLAEIALIPALEPAGEDRPACRACGLYKVAETPFMKAKVPNDWTQKLIIVGDQPSQLDDRSGGPAFIGPVGRIIRKLVAKAGYSRSDVVYTNAVRCRPSNDRKPSMKEIRCCRPLLLRTLSKLNPKRILLAGGIALKSAFNDGAKGNVGKSRGRRIQLVGSEFHSFVTYHPASILHGALNNQVRILEDLQRDTLPKLKYPKEELPW